MADLAADDLVRERDQALAERDQARQERDQARRERDEAQLERDRARVERDRVREALLVAQREWGHVTADSEQEHAELTTTNADLSRLIDILHDQERLKSKFYANMNHELRTPLSSILGFTEDAIDGLAGELTPELRRYLLNIQHSSQHLLGVITELLDLARIQTGLLAIDAKPFAFGDVLREAEAMMSSLVVKKGQTLQIPDVSDFPPILADGGKVLQILLNLLSNAHKYTPDGGRIEVLVEARNGLAHVAIVDDGTGIAPADIPYLFEEFSRVAKKGKPNPKGTGLGLAITKGLVEAMGGEVTVVSAPGRGSTFAFTLPLAT